jgi:hypothetical protein
MRSRATPRDAKDAVVSLFHVLAGDEGDDLGGDGTACRQLVVLEGLKGGVRSPARGRRRGPLVPRVVPVTRRLAGCVVVVVAY